MELLLVVGGIWLVIWLVGKFRSSGQTSSRSQSASNSATADRRATPAKPNVYRPKVRTPGRTSIKFSDTSFANTNAANPDASELRDLHDAFTGAPLEVGLNLFRCANCKVYYHEESYQVLVAENNRQCVACSSTNIVSLTTAKAKQQGGRDYDPTVITLENFRTQVGRVITFEGYVHDVLVSRRGKDFAVMFENKNWTKGLKLVFFRGAVKKVGGPKFVLGLKGKKVKARGLLIDHQRFGHEIIISEKSMILSSKK